MSRKKRKKPKSDRTRRGVFLLPNLFTTGSLFAGFYCLVAASQGRWHDAGLAIFFSAILDGLDGKVARLTRSTSRFGVEYDSLADLVAFGAAPAFMIHQWALADFGRLGWVAACLYVVCGALRLARFNIQVGFKDPRFFVGLPIPAAGTILAAIVLGAEHFQIPVSRAEGLVLILLYLLAFLEVSNLPYRSLKDVALNRKKSFNLLVAGVLVFSLVAYRPVLMGLILLALYLGSGPVVALVRALSRRRRRLKKETEAVVRPVEES